MASKSKKQLPPRELVFSAEIRKLDKPNCFYATIFCDNKYFQHFEYCYLDDAVKYAKSYCGENINYVNMEPPTEMDLVLSVLPDEFKGFVSSYAYEKSHAYGEAEVLLTAKDLTNDLLPSIKEFIRNHNISI